MAPVIEEHFYLMLPALIRFASANYPKALLLVGVALAPALRVLLHSTWLTSWPRRSSRCRAVPIACSWVCWARRCCETTPGEPVSGEIARRSVWPGVFLVGAGVVMLRDTNLAAKVQPQIVTIGYTWMAVLHLLLILCAVTWPGSLLSRCLRWNPLGWLGTIAYGNRIGDRAALLDLLRKAAGEDNGRGGDESPVPAHRETTKRNPPRRSHGEE